MPQPRKILYVSRVELSVSGSGGSRCCLDHLRRISANEDLRVIACLIGSHEEGERVRPIVEALGVALHFQELGGRPTAASGRPLRDFLGRRFPILFEADAIANRHVDSAVHALVREIQPDLVIVDYVPTALYVPSIYTLPIRRLTITLNREGDFFADLARLGLLPSNASDTEFARRRAFWFEARVYRRSNAVVALTETDLPQPRRGRIDVVIPPAFDPAPERWAYRGSRSLFFVGNIGHYPNRQAVEWLATRLAPALAAQRCAAAIRAIGAAEGDVPADWRGDTIAYLGSSNEAGVTREFLGADLFIAPIANAFGAKIKLLDSLRFGTPFAASDGATSGIPFISDVPRFDLDDPHGAAALVAGLLDAPSRLVALSENMRLDLLAHVAQQPARWAKVIADTMLTSPH